jgi:hypothetical protein
VGILLAGAFVSVFVAWCLVSGGGVLAQLVAWLVEAETLVFDRD